MNIITHRKVIYSNLDDAGEHALLAAVQELKSKGRTIFLITHRSEILSAADRVVVLEDGKITLDRPRDGIVFQTLPEDPPGNA